MPLKPLQGFSAPAEAYGFANKRLAWENPRYCSTAPSLLRAAHLRDPVGPQIVAIPAGLAGLFRGKPSPMPSSTRPAPMTRERLKPALA
jgi:hypothetical protein